MQVPFRSRLHPGTAPVRSRWAGAVLTASLLTQAACSTASHPRLPPPLSEDVRSRLGAITVSTRSIAPDIKPILVPRGAAAGMGSGALWGLRSTGRIAGVVGGPPSMGPGMVVAGSALVLSSVGAVAGAIETESAETIVRREIEFRTIVAKVPIQETLRDRVVATAARDTGRAFTALHDDNVSHEARTANTLLEVVVEEISLTERDSEFPGVPALWLTLTTRSRLSDAHSRATMYEQTLTYVGRQARHLKDWVGDDGRQLREELEAAIPQVADTIVDEIFLVYPFGSERR